MDKTISSLMTKNIVTVDAEDTVDRVEAIMDTHKLSCVPVIDSQGGCFGVISSSDLMHFHTLHHCCPVKNRINLIGYAMGHVRKCNQPPAKA